jgi:hypothetical protein
VRLVWVLVAAVLLGGCTASAQRGPDAAPGPSDPATVAAELLARPMRLPSLAPGGACPANPTGANPTTVNPVGPWTAVVDGLTTVRLNPQPSGADGLYESKVIWGSSGTGYAGPVVVRVGRLDGPGRGYVRLYYDEGASRGDAVVIVTSHRSQDWPSGTFVPGPGCYAYQLDWPGATEVIVFRVVPAAG